MQELRRILTDKRFLLVLLAIVVLNGILLYTDMKPDDETAAYNVRQYGENYKEDLAELLSQLETQYGEMDIEEAQARLSSFCSQYEEERNRFQETAFAEWDGTGDIPDYDSTLTVEEHRYRAVIGSLYNAYQYLLKYKDDIQQILDRADEQMENKNIFAEDSFAGRNIKKTKADFEKILDVEPEYGSQDAFEAVCNYNISDFIMLLSVMAAVIVILDERKKGLWEFVYSMPGGREKLSLIRIAVMAVVSFLSAGIIYGENILLAGLYHGGYGDVTRPIQSMEICEKVVMKVSVLQYLLLSFFWKFFILFFVGLFLLVLVLTMRSHIQVFFIFAVLMVGEYTAYRFIDTHSRFAILKYVNIFAWMDSEWCVRNYLNLNLFGYPVGLYQMMCIVPVVLFGLVSMAMVLSGRIYPFAIRQNRMKKVWVQLTAKLKLYRHGNMLLTELYKQFFVQKMWIIVVLAVIAGCYYYDDSEVYYDYQGTLYNAYMEMLAGDVTQEKLDYLQEETVLWQEQWEQQQELLLSDHLTLSEQQLIESKMKQFQEAEECTQELFHEAERLLGKKEAKAAVQFVNETGYYHYIGDFSRERNNRDGLLMLTLAVLLASVLFAGENAQNSKPLIHSTRNGRGKFRMCKYVTLLIEEILIFVPIVLSAYLTVDAKYGISQGEASVYSLSFLDGFFIDISIRMSVVLYLFLMFILLYLVMLFITLISERMRNVMASMVVCMAVAVLPAALYYMGFTYISGFTVLNELVVSGWLF